MSTRIPTKFRSYDSSKDGKSIFCQVRQKWVQRTPEEEVRQTVISWLSAEKGVPIEAIEVEISAGVGRADIIVCGKNGEKVCLIECKREDEPLTDDVVDQAIVYADIFSVDIIARTNGKYIDSFLYNEKSKLYCSLTKAPDYSEMCNRQEVGRYIVEPIDTSKRPTFKQLSEPQTQKDLGCIARDTPVHLRLFLLNLCSFFYDENNKMQPIDMYGLHLKDLGCKYSNAKTPVGGWEGNRRVFQIENAHIKQQIGIEVMRQTLLKSEPNRTLGSVLVATAYESYKPHNCLQLRLDDDSVRNNENLYTVLHKRGINHELLNFVEQMAPDLVRLEPQGKRVEIGTLDGSKLILWEQDATRTFVVNLLRYALLRREFKNK